MSDEISRLILSVESQQVGEADKKLQNLTKTSTSAEKATDGLTKSWAGMLAKVGALVGGYLSLSGSLRKIIDVTKESEAAQARLRAVTQSSATEARAMFEVLEAMGSESPAFTLDVLTEAFTTLVSRGLDPSRKALEAYMDLSAGTGASLSTVVDAIAMASNGVYRSLNQMGIRATQEMDGLVMTYRGSSEKIKGDIASIEAYMQRLAKTNFAGAAATQADTMGGALYRLQDAWDDVWRAVSERGIGEYIKTGLKMATDALAELEAMIASGQLGAYIDAYLGKWNSFTKAASDGLRALGDLWSSAMKAMGIDGAGMLDFFIDAMVNLPENVTAVVKGIGATFGLLVEYGVKVGQGVYDAIVGYLKFAYESAKNTGQMILDAALHPLTASTAFVEFYVKQTAATQTFAKTSVEAWDRTVNGIGNATDAWGEEITAIMDERDASLQAFKDKTDAAKGLREEYEKQKAAREGAGAADPLAGARKPRGNDNASQRAEYLQLRASLIDEELAVQESYDKRLALIRNSTTEGSDERVQMEKALNERLATERASAQQSHAERLQQQYLVEQDLLQEALNKREITEVEFQEKSRTNWASYQAKVSSISVAGARMVATQNLQMYQQVLGMAGDISAQLSTLVSESNGAAKAMFIASKAIAIAQAIVNTELAATKALAEGGMYAGMSMASVIRAMGYASVALMTATAVQEFSGMKEHGGMIPAGTWGITGEAGAEIVQGPAIVTSARSTADRGLAAGRANNTTVNVHNYSGGEVETRESEQPDGSKVIEVIVNRMKTELASDVSRGVGPFVRALQGAYPLTRGRT